MRRRPWAAIIIGGAVIAAAAGGLAGWRLSQHAAARPHASCGSAVTHGPDESTRALSADPGALACLLVVCTANPDELLYALRRISPRSALTATLTTRLIPVLGEDARRLAEAQRWLEKGAQLGDVDAMFDLGVVLKVRGKKQEVSDWTLKAAQSGLARAQAIYGNALEHGTDLAVNLAGAVAWYRKSAEQGEKAAARLEKFALQKAKRRERSPRSGQVGAANRPDGIRRCWLPAAS